jgi:rRNA maturation protein Nop10
MIDICPICGRYSLMSEYPPQPCPICEEDLASACPARLPLHAQPPVRPTTDPRTNV